LFPKLNRKHTHFKLLEQNVSMISASQSRTLLQIKIQTGEVGNESAPMTPTKPFSR